MNFFNRFIETSRGRYLWLFLMFFLLIFPSPYANKEGVFRAYDLIIWFVTALMSWFAIVYLADKLNLKYKKLWKIFSIGIPFFSFIIFIIVKNQQLDSISNVNKISDSRKVGFIKLFTLIGSFIFIIISASFLIGVDSYYKSVTDYIKLSDEETKISNDLYKVDNDLQNNPRKDLYITSLDLINKNVAVIAKENIKLKEIGNNFLASLFPEVNQRVKSAEEINEFNKNLNNANLEWNKSVLKDGYASNISQNLLIKVNNLNKDGNKLYPNKELTHHPSLISLLFGNSLTMIVYTSLFIYGLILIIFSIFIAILRFKQKLRFASLRWIILASLDVLFFGLFILILFYF